MYQYKMQTQVFRMDCFLELAQLEQLNENDLILTNKFIFEPFIKSCNVSCKIIFQETYGSGEPNDLMIDEIRNDIPSDIKRIIAVGGGTVIDIAKVLIFQGQWKTEDIFLGKVLPEKERNLIVVPTTCGTGSEVTNITICELKNQHTKKGLALDAMYPDKAVLIPELIKTLPYQFFATSSIDALIHAIESYVSPKAIPHSEAHSEKAISLILNGYQHMKENGRDKCFERAEDFLTASNLAGYAFGYAGCGAVHALSYPLGGKYHIPHGEANQLMFSEVFKKYKEKKPVGKINILEKLLGTILGCETENALHSLYQIMEFVLPKKGLREYGIQPEEFVAFSDGVCSGQQRLLSNNYVELTKEEMIEIYNKCY